MTPDRARGPDLRSLFGLYRTTPAGELLDANDELARMYGFPSARALHAAAGEPGFSFYAEERRRDEFLRQLEAGGIVRGFESAIRRTDGATVLIREHAQATRDAAGAILLIDGLVEDLAAGLPRDEERHDSEEKLQTLIGSVEDSLWSVDADYRLITFNAPFIRMFVELTGYVLKAGDRVTDLIPQDWREEEIVFYQRALRGERFVVEQRYLSFTGERFYELSFNPIHGPGGVSGVAVISKDSTERHRVQLELKTAKSAAESASRLKSEFLANMSHEIRTPMNGIMGMTDLLLRTPLAPDQREFVNTMRVSGESLLTVINDILDFSKIEAGKLQFETIDFDLREVVETTLDLFSAPALAKKLELGALTRPGVPTGLRGDPGRLRQILNNLLSNAVKFTEKGEIVLTVAAARQDAARVLLEFQLRDTGIGIDRAGQARLFEAFSQADGSMARRFGGTGLGLAISKRLVGMMHGEIRVDSVPGKGSVFTFTAAFERGAPAAPPPEARGRRVLIVSDNLTSRYLLGEYLRGTTWRLAWNFEMAHGLAAAEPFDAAIVDLPCTPEELKHLAAAVGGAAGAGLIVLARPGQRPAAFETTDNVRVLHKPLKQWRLMEMLEAVDPVIAPGETAVPAPPEASRALRILLAEDNTINQKVACGLLRNLGHVPDIAANGEEVLAALERGAYDLIFMDCQMPVMDGFEATRRVRALPIKQPLIVAMTANALPGDRERCLAAGMDDYITKPIRPEMLRDQVEAARGSESKR